MKINHKLHFHNKLFLYISGIIVTLSFAYIAFFSSYIYRNLLKEAKINLYQLTSKTAKDLETLFTDMDKLSLYISTNPDVTNAFSLANQSNYKSYELSSKISPTLLSISIPNNSSRFRINLMNEKGNFISTGIPYHKKITTEFLTSKAYHDWYLNLPLIHNNLAITPFQPDIWSDSDTLYFSLYREIFDSSIISKVLGVIEVQCPYYIVNNILSFQTGENHAYLFTNDGTLIYGSTSDEVDAHLLYTSFLDNQDSPYASGTYNGFLYSGVVLDNGWVLLLSQYQKQIAVVLRTFVLFVVLLGISTLGLCLGIIFIITKRTTKPLRELTAFAKQATLDNLSLPFDDVQYPDEVIRLTHAFQKMLARLKISMEENVERKTYEIRANMIALQSQMDPHFLYNMLTVIKAMGKEGKSQEIGYACNHLVDMLRYTSDYEQELVSLQKEINNADCYLRLMKLRYEDQFTYEYHITSEIEATTIMVPKLIIQPLLENCFQHGFKKVMPPWNIMINIWVDQTRYYIEVSDNGSGITNEAIEAFYERFNRFLQNPSNSIASLKIGGMGLINTFARLKLRYRDDVVLELSSPSLGGTKVLLGGSFSNESNDSRR